MPHTKTEGSWMISIGSAVGGAICLTLTALMLRHFGESLGATESGRQLLGAASMVVHLVGFVLMGLAAGYFCRVRNWVWASLVILIMLGSGGYTITSIMGFVATERTSVAKAREKLDQEAREAKEANERASKERRDAQLKMTKEFVEWTKKTVKTDELGRRERKDALEAATNAIAAITKHKEPETPAVSGPVITIRPDAQAEQLAELTGRSVNMVQLTMMAWIAVLLVALEMVLWPLASFTFPRRIDGGIIDLTPEQPEAVQDKPAPAALGPARPAPVAIAPPPAKAAEPIPESQPVLRKPLPGAEASLRAIGFPLEGRPQGPQREKLKPRVAAQNFAIWLKAFGHDTARSPEKEQGFSARKLEELYGEFCHADHRDQASFNLVCEALPKLSGVTKTKPRVNPDNPNERPIRWLISPGRFPKVKEAELATGEPQVEEKEAGILVKFRPLAVASLEAANENAPARPKKASPTMPWWEAFERDEARKMKAMHQQIVARSRKQRGSRVTKTVRAA